MTLRRLLYKVAVFATISSLTVTPELVSACTFYAPMEVRTNHMQQFCRTALANPKRFLAKVEANAFEEGQLRDYVLAFDEGKYGCRKNTKFVFRILDSFYSVPERLYSEPELLRRYAFAWPENHDPVKSDNIDKLMWLFGDYAAYLPKGWTAEDARSLVAQPEHFKIALARFGNARDRDDAVFANISDPASSHYDRDVALRLSAQPSKHQLAREIVTASLFADPLFGPTDFAKAESLLPLSALYAETKPDPDPLMQQAHGIWIQIASGYAQSGEAVLRARGQRLQAKINPPALANSPTITHPNDGRIWLSLANWPKAVANPFAEARFAPLITADDYPARAVRDEETGTVTVAARFGPDGRFSALEVIQSSGSTVLDGTTVTTVNRRFRPKLDEVILAGYPGKEVRVPLLIVDWQLAELRNQGSGTTSFADGRLSVVRGRWGREVDELSNYHCGPVPSIFL